MAELDHPYPSSLDLVLHEDACIAGVVLDPSGRPAAEPTLVVAWENTRNPDASFVTMALGGSRTLLNATTDGSGAFQLRGADESKEYNVVAGRKGFLADAQLNGVRPNQGPVTLRLGKLFGALVEIRDEHGDVLKANEALIASSGGRRWHLPDKRSRMIPATSRWLALCGEELNWYRHESSRYTELFIAISDVETQAIEASMAISIPGYESAESPVALLPIASGLSQSTISLARTADGFGTIELEITGTDPAFSSERRDGTPDAVVRFGALERSRRPEAFDLPLFSLENKTVRLDGVPHGLFRATLLCDFSDPVVLGDFKIGDEPVKMVVDASRFGCCKLLPKWHDGRQYRGALRVYMTPTGDSGAVMRVLEQAPYVLGGLSMGSYELDVRALPETSAGASKLRIVVENSLASVPCELH